MAKDTDSSSGVDEFLNPKSMVTPGIAGSLTMTISNSLYFAFNAPAAITTAILSLLLATVVFKAGRMPLWHRGVFYLLNALIIFSVSWGTNAASTRASPGQQAIVDASGGRAAPELTNQLVTLSRQMTNHFAMIYRAHGAGTTNNVAVSNALHEINKNVTTLNADIQRLVTRPLTNPPALRSERTFFHKW